MQYHVLIFESVHVSDASMNRFVHSSLSMYVSEINMKGLLYADF